AVRDLLKPGGQVIPARGAVRVALAELNDAEEVNFNDVAGFDLSGFRTLAPPVRRIRIGDNRLSLRSEAADLFVFDLASADYCAPAQASVAARSSGGRINGIVQWIRIELDEIVHYENRPVPGAHSCWAARFYPFEVGLETEPGHELLVYGSHD